MYTHKNEKKKQKNKIISRKNKNDNIIQYTTFRDFGILYQLKGYSIGQNERATITKDNESFDLTRRYLKYCVLRVFLGKIFDFYDFRPQLCGT